MGGGDDDDDDDDDADLGLGGKHSCKQLLTLPLLPHLLSIINIGVFTEIQKNIKIHDHHLDKMIVEPQLHWN